MTNRVARRSFVAPPEILSVDGSLCSNTGINYQQTMEEFFLGPLHCFDDLVSPVADNQEEMTLTPVTEIMPGDCLYLGSLIVSGAKKVNLAKTIASPSRVAGVSAQYTLHI
ncbi:hypothetical protein GcM3_183031 [Golovinomyces cichoracearum]|uniref:Uncharacterized protein n=1 Tax=Golovinomyces cichoracearum TaxID=62708 RepID=A0A420HLI3_9PEZI|nr:hypothetical protein GcM3_183031 [Golovinomyces cichoracearum]